MLTEFLKNPVSNGVWHLRRPIPFSAIDELQQWIMTELSKSGVQAPPSQNQLKSSYSQKYGPLAPARSSVTALAIYLYALGQEPISHKPVVDWTQRTSLRNYNPTFYSVLEPRLLIDSMDALSGYAVEIKDNLVLNAVSLKEIAIDDFENLWVRLPGFQGKVNRLIRKKKYGSNYVYRAYALSAHLWLASEESAAVPEGVLAFLEPSLNYYDTAQWRTSIVLAAISVEHVLSEMFEELFRSPTPEIPLGQLYEKVKAKKNFPSDEDVAIRRTNEILVKAVHRTAWFASEKDALDALMGAVRLVIWYYLES
jgi:hypothetical protein